MAWRQSSEMEITSNEDATVANTTLSSDAEIIIKPGSLTFAAGPMERNWTSEDVQYVITQRVPNVMPAQWVLHIANKQQKIELMQSYNEQHVLTLAEDIAKYLDARLAEHTGRKVREDEHGMNVIQQIEQFPERWSRSEKLPSMKLQFTTTDKSSVIRLPSMINMSTWIFLMLSILASFAFGMMLTFATMRFSIESVYSIFMWSTLMVTLTLMIWIWMDSGTGSLESNHTLELKRDSVNLKGRIFGFIPQPVNTWSIEEFRDLDVNEFGEVTFLFGKRRLRVQMHRREGEWLVGEVATQLERILANEVRTVLKQNNSSLKDAFDSFDTNSDGKLSQEEMVVAIAELEIGLTAHQAMVLIRSIDTDDDEFIDYEEFTASLSSGESSSENIPEEEE